MKMVGGWKADKYMVDGQEAPEHVKVDVWERGQ